MPFTLSHVAAVLPLRRLMPALPLSAMVIGSMVPDFGFLVPLLDRHMSHSFVGLFLFCLPVGWLMQLLFWHGLQEPLLNLASRPLERRLQATMGMESRGFLHVSTGLLVGALTHIVWDGFTHVDGFVARNLPILQLRLVMLGEQPWLLTNLLQHLSSALGLIALAMYACRWFIRTTPEQTRTAQYRVFWLLLLFLAPLGTALLSLLAWLPDGTVEHIAAQAAARGLESAGACLLGYALWWRFRQRIRRR